MPYCLSCDYDLRSCSGSCPECGRAFSIDKPGTYSESPRGNVKSGTSIAMLKILGIFYVFTAITFVSFGMEGVWVILFFAAVGGGLFLLATISYAIVTQLRKWLT